MGMTKEYEEYIRKLEFEASREAEIKTINELWTQTIIQKPKPVLMVANPFFVVAAIIAARYAYAVKNTRKLTLNRDGIDVKVQADFYP